jgi:hypothetical protein
MLLLGFNKRLFWSFFLLFGVIFVSYDSLLFGTNGNQTYIYAKYFYATFLTVIMLFVDLFKSTEFQEKAFYYCFLMVIISFINMIATQDFSLGNIYRIIMFPYAMCVVRRVRLDDFKFIYDALMTVLCFVSVLFFFIHILSPSIMRFFPIVANSLGNGFYSIGIYNASIFPMFRNFGFAREPGVFQAFIAVALLIQISNSFKTNYYKIALYLVTMFTTFSTTGFIVTIIWAFLFLYEERKYKAKKYLFIFILIVIAFAMMYFNLFALIDSMSVMSKLSRTSDYSAVSRYTSIITNLYICFYHPLFGVGIQRIAEISPLLSYRIFGVYAVSNTNTIFYHFGTQGVLYATLWVIPYVFFAKSLFDRCFSRILCGLVLLLVCFGELFCYSGFFYLLIFYSFKKDTMRSLCVFMK